MVLKLVDSLANIIVNYNFRYQVRKIGAEVALCSFKYAENRDGIKTIFRVPII